MECKAYEAASPVLLFGASVGFTKAWVMVVTDPAGLVIATTVVTIKGAL